MKIIKTVTLAIIALTIVSCNNNKRTANKTLKTEVDSVSYIIGLNVANNIKRDFKEINSDIFMQGFLNGLDSTDILIKPQEANKILRTYFQKKQLADQKKAMEKIEKEYADVKKAGEAFLAENKTKAGVKTTASGLQYVVLKEGKGEHPKATDRVRLHYHGTLTDGTVFDSSVERNKPYELGVNQFVKGFSEGLQLMNEGAKYKFFIPQELAYGATPRGGKIKPFMPLVFEVELLKILK